MANSSILVFYGAVSLDGYIARKDHSLDWLIGTEGEEDTGYDEFYATVDTLIMGRKTYEQIQILSPGEFPYKGKKCYVFSRTLSGATEDVEFVSSDIATFAEKLKKAGGSRVWVVGGGEILHPIIRAKLMDEFIIQTAPVILGDGIPLFLPGDHEVKLKLKDVKRYKQFAEMSYDVKET